MNQRDSKILRSVLGCFATGVAVITARTAGNDHIGVTVNSFSSVSLDPPLILFSLARTAKVLARFQETESFAVSILGHGQEAVSNMFARPSTALWENVSFATSEDGCALLANSLAHLECRKAAELEGGDHVILLGSVVRFHLKEMADPLLFYRGRYGTYARDQLTKLPPQDGSLSDFAVTGWG